MLRLRGGSNEEESKIESDKTRLLIEGLTNLEEPESYEKLREKFARLMRKYVNHRDLINAKFENINQIFKKSQPLLITNQEETEKEILEKSESSKQEDKSDSSDESEDSEENLSKERSKSSFSGNEDKKIAIIFANQHFETLEERKGAQIDLSRSRKILKSKGYKVRAFNDLKANEMVKQVSEIKKTDITDLIIVISSHGKAELIAGSDGEFISVVEFWRPFESFPLMNKLMVLQACHAIGEQNKNYPLFPYPNSFNWYFASSCQPGYFAISLATGSPFIQFFLSRLEKSTEPKSVEKIMRETRQLIRKDQYGSKEELPLPNALFFSTSVTKMTI